MSPLLEFSAPLHQHNLMNALGVRRQDEYELELSVELTEGQTNMMSRRDSVKNSEVIEADWASH